MAEDAIAEEQDNADAPLPDDPKPDDRFRELALGAALAETLKPIAPATEEIWSPDPTRKQVRETIVSAYKAETEADGALRAKYEAAMASFVRAANDMLAVREGRKSRLETWIASYLDPGKPLQALFTASADLAARVKPRGGTRERARDFARRATSQYADAYKAWSDPVAAIGAKIGTVADDIDALNASINLDQATDYAIYRIWFDYAPRLLQLSPDSVNSTIAPGVDLITAKLTAFPARLEDFKSGKDRTDGSIYLVAASGLDKVRRDILDAWKAAAKAQAEAEADFTLRPDDTITLNARYDDALQGEGAAAKAILAPTANS